MNGSKGIYIIDRDIKEIGNFSKCDKCKIMLSTGCYKLSTLMRWEGRYPHHQFKTKMGDGDEAQTECSFRIGAQSKRSRNAKKMYSECYESAQERDGIGRAWSIQ